MEGICRKRRRGPTLPTTAVALELEADDVTCLDAGIEEAQFPSNYPFFFPVDGAPSDEATLTGTVDPHFSKFWQELLRDPSLPSGTVRFFETNVLAGGKAGRAFFMRPVYEDILSTLSGYFNRFQNARERVDFAMTGTPGIGKTYFATCLLASLVRQFASRTPDENFVVYPNAPAIVYVDDEGHALRLLWTTGTVVRVDYDHLLSLPSSSLVILDGIHPKHGELLNGVREGRVVWIASPRNTATSLTNPFQKFVNSECYIICMPVMSEWEVFQAEAAWRNIAGQDDAAREKRRREVRERFHQCGGVARALFGDPFDVRGNAAFEWFESTLRSEDEDEVRLAVRTVNFANIDLYSKVRHRLVHCVSGRKGDNPFALVNMEFASVRFVHLSPVGTEHLTLLLGRYGLCMWSMYGAEVRGHNHQCQIPTHMPGAVEERLTRWPTVRGLRESASHCTSTDGTEAAPSIGYRERDGRGGRAAAWS
eukprot:TRINITY_DN709_c0_g1_i1.p1 TRINITY_DN709_c0_g1~~TRINITY_DN709_c0_g1_i1.p1  ORF type:complete len:480 (+),score=35.78 TRINITY_DN709_c0_g1_i1:254-1693(+)